MLKLTRALTVIAMFFLTAAVYLAPAVATSGATYADRFDAQSYTGDNGSASFTGPWVEIGESDGATAGKISVAAHPYCTDSYCLRMGGLLVTLNNKGAERELDLEGVASAVLSWDWGRSQLLDLGGEDGEEEEEEEEEALKVKAQVSAGGSWTTLMTMKLDRDDDGLSNHAEFDITGYASPTTMIRFISTSGVLVQSYLLVDNVEVMTTTESTTTTTTSTTSPPTTTTTTTTLPPTTTTTAAAPTTTTTIAATTITATPPTTTTTTTTTTTSTTLPTDETDALPAPGEPSGPGDGGGEQPSGGVNRTSMIGLTVPDLTARYVVPGLDDAGASSGRAQVSPIRGLVTTFAVGTGVLRGTGLAAVALGLLIAALAVRGLEDRTRLRYPTGGVVD